jgi:diacylglycerol kinase family enzyme
LRTLSTVESRLWLAALVCALAAFALGALVANREPSRLDLAAQSLRGGAVPLALFTTEDPSRAGALRTYLAFGAHAQDALRHAHVVTAKRFTIRTRAKQTISIDGALLERTPARFRVAREALRVFVPEHGGASA